MVTKIKSLNFLTTLQTHMYRNFTEALIELFGIGKSVLEIAPGVYTTPTISIFQYLKPREYIAVDGAFDLDDAFGNFNQVGGLQYYSKDISRFFGSSQSNLLLVNSLAHALSLRSESVDNILFVKTLCKLTDGIVHCWEKVKESVIEEYKKRGINQLTEEEFRGLAIYTYQLLVLDEARRVGKEGIIIIPEGIIKGIIIGEELLEEIKIYSELTGNEFYVFEVRTQGWEIEEDGKVKVIGHWQDNSTKELIYLKIKNHNPISKEGIVEYLKRIYESRLSKSSLLRSLYEKIL